MFRGENDDVQSISRPISARRCPGEHDQVWDEGRMSMIETLLTFIRGDMQGGQKRMCNRRSLTTDHCPIVTEDRGRDGGLLLPKCLPRIHEGPTCSVPGIVCLEPDRLRPQTTPSSLCGSSGDLGLSPAPCCSLPVPEDLCAYDSGTTSPTEEAVPVVCVAVGSMWCFAAIAALLTTWEQKRSEVLRCTLLA